MGSHLRKWFAVIEVVVIDGVRFFADLGMNHAMLGKGIAQAFAHVCIISQGFGHNVAGACNGGFGIGQFIVGLCKLFGIAHKCSGFFTGTPSISQWRQATFNRHAGTGFALWPIWTIEILQFGHGNGCFDFFRQRIGKLVLLCNQAQHIGTALL